MTRRPKSIPSVRLSVRVDAGLYGRMIALEKTTGKSISEQVREALAVWEVIARRDAPIR